MKKCPVCGIKHRTLDAATACSVSALQHIKFLANIGMVGELKKQLPIAMKAWHITKRKIEKEAEEYGILSE